MADKFDGTKTPIYNFNLPTPGADEDTWGIQLNQNWSNLDNYLAAKAMRVDAHLEGEPTAPEPTDVTTPSNRIANMAAVIKAVFANVFWDKIQNKPTEFPPVKASNTTLGGVKVGTSLTIAADGTLNTVAGEGEVLPGKNYNIPMYKGDGNVVGPAPGMSYYQGGLSLGDGTYSGSLYLSEDSGGAVTIAPAVNTGVKWTFYLPPSIGTNGQTLTWFNGSTIWKDPPALQPAGIGRLGGVMVGGSFGITGSGSLLLNQALATQLGGVKVSNDDDGIDISPDGTITVHKASATQFGGIKLGNRLKQRGTDGTVDVDVYVATPIVAGVVKPGAGLTVSGDGTLAVSGSASTSVANVLVFDGVGSFQWTPPPDCTFARFSIVGGGGSGADQCNFVGGGGGGAGGYVSAVLNANVAKTFYIVNGAGGTRNTSTGSGGDGHPTSITVVRKDDGTSHQILGASGGKGGDFGSNTDDLPANGGSGGYGYVDSDRYYLQPGSFYLIRGGEGGYGTYYQSTKWPHANGRFMIGGRGGSTPFGGGNQFFASDAYGAGGSGGTDRQGQFFGKDGVHGFTVIEYDGTPQTNTPLPPQFDGFEPQSDGKVKVTFTPASSSGPHVEAKSFVMRTYDVMNDTTRIDELTVMPTGQLATVVDWLLAGRVYDIELAGVNIFGRGDWSPLTRITMPGFPFALELLGNRNGGADFQLNGFGLDLDKHVVSATYAVTMNSKVIKTDTYAGSLAAFYSLGIIYHNDMCLPYARPGFYPKNTTAVTGNKYIYEGYEKLEIPFGAGVCTCDVKLTDGRTAKLSVNFNNDMSMSLGPPVIESADISERNRMVLRLKPIINPIPNSTVTALYAKINFWWVKYPVRKDENKIIKCDFVPDDTGVTVTIPLDWPEPIEGADWKLWLNLVVQVTGSDGVTYASPISFTLNETPGCGLPGSPLLPPTLTEVRWQKSTSTFYVSGKYNLVPGDPNKYVFPDGVWSAIVGPNGYHYAVSKDTLDTGDLVCDCRTKDFAIPSGTVLTYRIYSMSRDALVWTDSPDTYKVP